jgi:hypothetical protein
MRRFGFQALGTDAWVYRLQKVMRPAFPPARFGMSPLWIRHERSSPSLGVKLSD